MSWIELKMGTKLEPEASACCHLIISYAVRRNRNVGAAVQRPSPVPRDSSRIIGHAFVRKYLPNEPSNPEVIAFMHPGIRNELTDELRLLLLDHVSKALTSQSALWSCGAYTEYAENVSIALDDACSDICEDIAKRVGQENALAITGRPKGELLSAAVCCALSGKQLGLAEEMNAETLQTSMEPSNSDPAVAAKGYLRMLERDSYTVLGQDRWDFLLKEENDACCISAAEETFRGPCALISCAYPYSAEITCKRRLRHTCKMQESDFKRDLC